jgi:cell division inhibitor SepF
MSSWKQLLFFCRQTYFIKQEEQALLPLRCAYFAAAWIGNENTECYNEAVIRNTEVMNMAFEKLKNFIAPVDDEYDDGEELEYTESETTPVASYEKKGSRVSAPSDAQMVLFEPRSFEESEEIARHLKQRRACVVNLHRLQREYAQRTIDFLTGVVFALDGSIQKIGHNVILCTPRNVGVDGEISLDSEDD